MFASKTTKRFYTTLLCTQWRRVCVRLSTSQRSEEVDALVIKAIRNLALVDDRAPPFTGIWTPTLADYRRELSVTPRCLFANYDATLDPFLLVKKDLSRISGHIKEFIRSDHPLLHAAATYLFDMDTGKKIRATMVLLTAKACGGKISDQQRRLAEIIEMIHTASLFHDDVIDAADTRRGLSSTKGKFGDKVAILAGDFLLARACTALPQLQNLEVIELISMVIEHLVRGEIIQMRPKIPDGTIEVTPTPMEAYLQKNYYKTGSLMANACRAAAMLENKDRTTCDAAFQYGRHVGLAFQLVDDILDFEGTGATLGKPVLADIQLGLATAPTLFAAEEFPKLSLLLARNFSQSGDVNRAIDIVQDSEGLRRTKDLATVQTELAIDSLNKLPDSEARKGLRNVAIKVVTRHS